MSKEAPAGLLLKLYELRRDPTMREAREWYFREFAPESKADIDKAMFSAHSGHVRMVMSYWDMAASLVMNGAIDQTMFNEANGEHFGVFAAVELYLGEMRAAYGPQFMGSLEKLIDATPGGRERTAMMRDRMKMIRATLAKQAGGA